MKKRLLYALATLVMLIATANIYAVGFDGGNPPPNCNPATDPFCK